MFKESFQHYDFYKNYRRYVQQKLSSIISRDQTEVELESIEHIMPQSIKEDKWPGITPADHIEWINTIGNLTPLNMPDNIDNSNHSFSDKIANIKKSDWQITREIDTNNGWGIVQIKKRGAELADHAVDIWKGPAVRTREVEIVQRSDKKRLKKFIDWINEFELPNYTLDLEHSSSSYLRIKSEAMERIMPACSDEGGIWTANAYYYELKVDTSGWTRLNLTLSSENKTPEQECGQKILMDLQNKYPPKENWKWFNIIGWTLEYDDGDEILKDHLRKILEDTIPLFESEVAEFGTEHSKIL